MRGNDDAWKARRIDEKRMRWHGWREMVERMNTEEMEIVVHGRMDGAPGSLALAYI